MGFDFLREVTPIANASYPLMTELWRTPIRKKPISGYDNHFSFTLMPAVLVHRHQLGRLLGPRWVDMLHVLL